MKASRTLILVFAAAISTATTPAWGVSKEILQLQGQVQNLQDQMTSMQRSFDERMGVMRNLVEQQTDSMNKILSGMNQLQTALQKRQQIRRKACGAGADFQDP